MFSIQMVKKCQILTMLYLQYCGYGLGLTHSEPKCTKLLQTSRVFRHCQNTHRHSWLACLALPTLVSGSHLPKVGCSSAPRKMHMWSLPQPGFWRPRTVNRLPVLVHLVTSKGHFSG